MLLARNSSVTARRQTSEASSVELVLLEIATGTNYKASRQGKTCPRFCITTSTKAIKGKFIYTKK